MTRSRLFKLPIVVALVAVVLILRRIGHTRRVLRGLIAVLFAYPGEEEVEGALSLFSGIFTAIVSLIRRIAGGIARPIWDSFWKLVDRVDALADTVKHLVVGGLGVAGEALKAIFGFLYGFIIEVGAAAAAALDTAKAALGATINAVYWALLASLDFLRSLMFETVAAAKSFAVAVAAGVRDLVIRIIYEVRDLLLAALGGARDLLLAIIYEVRDLLLAALGGARDLLLAIIYEVRDLLVALIEGAKDLARALVGDVWHFLYKFVVGPLEDLGQFVWHEVQDAVDIVHAALDWLVWMGEVAFSDVVDLIEAAASFTMRDLLDGIVDASARTKGDIFTRVDRSLGGRR